MCLDDPQARVPNRWYDLTPRYSGTASITFGGEPPIEGSGAFSFSAEGEAKIEFECRDAEQSGRLDQILSGGQPGVLLPAGPPRPTQILIASQDGTYVADYRVYLTSHSSNFGGQQNSAATFRAIGATFSANQAGPAACFVMPLYNMLSPSFVVTPQAQPPDIAQHPLRIFPTPPTHYDPNDQEAFFNVNWHNQLITFQIDGHSGLIEALPDYRDRAARLRAGDSKALITALMVCNAAGRICLANDPATWFPIEVLNLLSLATGQRVGAPWIEYRDANGQIVSRVHRHFGSPPFEPGHAIIDEAQEPNTGYVITQGFQYADLASKNTRLMLTHLFNAGQQHRAIDERLLSLFRAYEIIAVEQNVARTNLRGSLDVANSASVQTALDNCYNSLRAAAGATTEPQRSVLNRIADRARGADQQDVVFGLALGRAATSLGFHDPAVLDAGFTATNGSGWPGFLSQLRGDVVHQGGLDLLSGAYDVQEVARVANHLLDLLLRIVARRLSLQSNYAASVFPAGMLRDIGWVNPATPVTQLVPA